MNRQFCLTHTVRYDECNSEGFLTPTAFLRYMQDLAAQDAEDANLSGDGNWVVKRTAITFTKPIPIHTRLQLKTYGMGFTRITAQRGYEAHIIDDRTDEAAISARTLWVYLDPRGRPTRIPDQTAQIWLPDGPQPQQPETPLPKSPESEPEIAHYSVRFSDVDLMKHLNNASAVEILDNAAWEAYAQGELTPDTTRFDILHYEIDYLDSPLFGEKLEVQSWYDFPVSGREHVRFQQITRAGNVMTRARSRWQCKAKNGGRG
jgi:acyl-CoA thioesterase FadM